MELIEILAFYFKKRSWICITTTTFCKVRFDFVCGLTDAASLICVNKGERFMSPQRLTDALNSCCCSSSTTVLHQKCTKQSPKVRSRAAAAVLAFLMNTPVCGLSADKPRFRGLNYRSLKSNNRLFRVLGGFRFLLD